MNLKNIVLLIMAAGALSACEILELDNFDGPDAELQGQIIDMETGELIQQDIINGCQIQIWEHGYNPVTPQNLIIKTTGEYRNSMLFSNTYDVIPIRPNFHSGDGTPVDTLEVDINGTTTINFEVMPYIRIKEPVIEQIGDIVQATFKIEQTIDSLLFEGDTAYTHMRVSTVGLYAHKDPNVGEPMQLGSEEDRVNEMIIEGVNDEFILEFDVSRDADFVDGGISYFRIGALLNISQAEFNYAPTVELDLTSTR